MENCKLISKTTGRCTFEGTQEECEEYRKLLALPSNFRIVASDLAHDQKVLF